MRWFFVLFLILSTSLLGEEQPRFVLFFGGVERVRMDEKGTTILGELVNDENRDRLFKKAYEPLTADQLRQVSRKLDALIEGRIRPPVVLRFIYEKPLEKGEMAT